MAGIKITELGLGTPKGTDVVPAVDTTDFSMAPTGTDKKYTRSSELNFTLDALGLNSIAATLVATTGALTATYNNGASGVGATLTNSGAQAAFATDGVTPAAGSRVLVKNQAAPAQNGIYTLTTAGTGATNWVLTRTTDYDQAADIAQFDIVLVNQGATNGGLTFIQTTVGPFTIGTTAITFIQYYAGVFPSSSTDNAVARFDGTSGHVLQNSAVTIDDSGNIAAAGLTLSTTPLNAASGGSGVASPTIHGILVAQGASAFATKVLTNGQVLIGSTGVDPVGATLTAGTGVSITNGAGSITITADNGGVTWSTLTSGSTPLADSNGYIANGAIFTLVTLTLPVTAAVGDTYIILGKGAGGWSVTCGVGQSINVGAVPSTAGVGGSISSTNNYDCVTLTCITANTTWNAYAIQGNLTVV